MYLSVCLWHQFFEVCLKKQQLLMSATIITLKVIVLDLNQRIRGARSHIGHASRVPPPAIDLAISELQCCVCPLQCLNIQKKEEAGSACDHAMNIIAFQCVLLW